MGSVRVFAPATVANVGCAFDVLGFALHEPGDEVVVSDRDEPGVVITVITGDGGALPRDARRNTAGVAVQALLDRLGEKRGVALAIDKKMPLGSGLGSSAASAVAGVFGANLLLGEPLPRRELLPFCIEAERSACGSGHADNVAPALLGGFVLIRSYNPLDVISLRAPPSLFCAVVHPHVEVRTEDARKILKQEIPLRDAVVQWGNVAGLIAGLLRNDYDLIGRSLQDVIIEPARSVLIPGFAEVKRAALAAGALGASISGSGPSVFAFATSEHEARCIGKAMSDAFGEIHVASDVHISGINSDGPRIC